jgi:hypothetical protein
MGKRQSRATKEIWRSLASLAKAYGTQQDAATRHGAADCRPQRHVQLAGVIAAVAADKDKPQAKPQSVWPPWRCRRAPVSGILPNARRDTATSSDFFATAGIAGAQKIDPSKSGSKCGGDARIRAEEISRAQSSSKNFSSAESLISYSI